LKRLFDHSKGSLRAISKLALGVNQWKLLFFRFAENAYQKSLTIRSRGFAVWATAAVILTFGAYGVQ
jgi:hypothetical protein